ncbi:MAG TPA: hypothetical protein VGO52_18220 [Hyphomonadaceae bacterium]|jgi:hypothetical protein|nr:hypothetical protein [Hyphomonadaceae bacterium]
MGEQFILKPTPFGKPVTVVVDNHAITTLQGAKSRSMAFKDVESAYSWIHRYGGVLSFVGRYGGKIEIAGVWGLFIPKSEGNTRAYFRASSAALNAYAAARPGAEVHVGRSVRDNRKTMAFTLVATILIGAVTVLRDGRVEPFEYAAVPIMLVAVGYVGLRRFNVVKQPPRHPASAEAAECAQAADEIVLS